MKEFKVNSRACTLDLEMNQPSGRVIQIGAVVGDVYTGEIVGKFSQLVDTGEDIHPEIIKLTKINNKKIKESGVSLLEAYNKLVSFRDEHKAFICPLSWGADADYLKNQLLKEGHSVDWAFGYDGEFNVKKLYQTYRWAMEKKLQGGVASAVKKFGRKFEGQKHDALDDSLNTFYIFHEILKLIRSK